MSQEQEEAGLLTDTGVGVVEHPIAEEEFEDELEEISSSDNNDQEPIPDEELAGTKASDVSEEIVSENVIGKEEIDAPRSNVEKTVDIELGINPAEHKAVPPPDELYNRIGDHQHESHLSDCKPASPVEKYDGSDLEATAGAKEPVVADIHGAATIVTENKIVCAQVTNDADAAAARSVTSDGRSGHDTGASPSLIVDDMPGQNRKQVKSDDDKFSYESDEKSPDINADSDHADGNDGKEKAFVPLTSPDRSGHGTGACPIATVDDMPSQNCLQVKSNDDHDSYKGDERPADIKTGTGSDHADSNDGREKALAPLTSNDRYGHDTGACTKVTADYLCDKTQSKNAIEDTQHQTNEDGGGKSDVESDENCDRDDMPGQNFLQPKSNDDQVSYEGDEKSSDRNADSDHARSDDGNEEALALADALLEDMTDDSTRDIIPRAEDSSNQLLKHSHVTGKDKIEMQDCRSESVASQEVAMSLAVAFSDEGDSESQSLANMNWENTEPTSRAVSEDPIQRDPNEDEGEELESHTPFEEVMDEFEDENSAEVKMIEGSNDDDMVEQVVINPKPIIVKKRKRRSGAGRLGPSKKKKRGPKTVTNEPAPQKPNGEENVEGNEEDIDEIGKIVEFIKNSGGDAEGKFKSGRRTIQNETLSNYNDVGELATNNKRLGGGNKVKLKIKSKPNLVVDKEKCSLTNNSKFNTRSRRNANAGLGKRKTESTGQPIKELRIELDILKEPQNSKDQADQTHELQKTENVLSKTKTSPKKSNTQSNKSKSVKKANRKHCQIEDSARSEVFKEEHKETSKSQMSSNKNNQQATNASCYFKPIQNWHKILRLPSRFNEVGSKLTENQIYKNALDPYVPCVPPNTSQRCIDSLSDTDVDQISCPGCKDRFLLPTSFYNHLYRRSVMITFTCGPCGDANMTFYNKCHLRVHALTHLEVNGVSSVPVVEPETLAVTSLSPEQLDVGFAPAPSTDQLRQEFATFSPDKCPECFLSVGEDKISAHFKGIGSIKIDCDDCGMVLPSSCTHKAHKRIHEGGMAPRVCPECGTCFETRAMLVEHVTHTCMHMGRVLATSCKACGQHVDEVEDHVFKHHVKMVYKCTACPKAFVSKDLWECHRSMNHPDLTEASRVLYRGKILGSNLFSTMEEVNKRTKALVAKWPTCFMFKCYSCKSLYKSSDELRRHNSKWCQLQTGVKIKHNLFDKDGEKPVCPQEVARKEKLRKIQAQIRHLKRTFTDETEETWAKQCSDFLGSLERQAEAHLNSTNSTSNLEDKTGDELEERAKPEAQTVVASPGDYVEDYRITRRRIIGTPMASVASPTQKEDKPPVEPPKEEHKPQPEELKKLELKKKKQLKKAAEMEPLVESLGKDMLSSRRLLAYNKLNRRSLQFGSTVSAKKSDEETIRCGVCSFSTEDEDSFQAHIVIHRPPSGVFGTDFFQCRLCGMSFASEPSWRKHLFLLHRVKRPPPDFYCDSLANVGRADVAEPPSCSSGEDELVIDETPHLCKVCDKRFATQVEYKRHIRTHGMAFLKMKDDLA